MSYLNLAKGIPDFSKAVISLWFRVPQESIDAAAAVFKDILLQTIPLVTFGMPQTKILYYPVYKDIVTSWTTPPGFPFPQQPIMEVADYVADGEEPIDPSYIGLVCFENEQNIKQARLVINLQMGDRAPIASAGWVSTGVDVVVGETGLSAGTYTIKDVSYIHTAAPEFFYVQTSHIINPDTWHHLLLSFDLSGVVAIGQPRPTSDCKLWYAIDDIDYRGAANLGPNRDTDDGLGVNVILTENAYHLSGGTPGTSIYREHPIPAITGVYVPQPIPTNDAELGIPASAKYVDGVYRVEMAELQMWTGVTLDTGITSNRRAFVDLNGKPVKPEGTKDDPQAPAEKLLGKKPEILLHKSGNWKSGYNTGTTGVLVETATDGTQTLTKIPAGQFTPVAGIERYRPDPSLQETPTA